jgi:FMN phosphatase YigB (HAD superfamily)
VKVRAVIVDIYKTILEVGPPPADAAGRWEFLWQSQRANLTRLTLAQFAAACETIIGREHEVARDAGVQNPEVFWPAVAKEALPELTRLNETDLDEFLYQHAQLRHTIRLMSGAGESLGKLAKRNLLLGIASNAQPYTLRELDAALGSAKLSRCLFKPELCFWSFAFGFSKPNPHVFRFLAARLKALGVSPPETLIVADRLDNDVEPAGSQGFRTWHFQPAEGDGETGGNWRQFNDYLGAGFS